MVVIDPEPDRVHESMAGAPYLLPLVPGGSHDRLAVRAARLWERRRGASARRWSIAAIEQCRRVEDDAGAAQAFARLVQYSGGQEVAPLVARGLRLFDSLDELPARSLVAAGLAELWITSGALESATAVLAGVAVECELTGHEVPPWIREPQCEVACWQGGWDRVEDWARAPANAGWRAVASFARRDWATLQSIGIAIVPHAWQALVAVMSSASRDDLAGLRRAVREMRHSSGPPRWRDALVLESLRMTGAGEEAAEWVAEMGAKQRGPLDGLLWSWMVGHVEGSDAAIRRLDAVGIRRWGVGRDEMKVWAGVAALLAEIQESEDPGTAIRRGCRWARDYTGAGAVAIASADGSLIARSPEADGPRVAVQGRRECIRYGGVDIGHVVFEGSARDSAEAQAVALALATACAPAVRAHLDELRSSRAGESLAGDLLGISPAMCALRDSVARAAHSSFPVLIEGESGTGKELVARAVHRLSARRDRRWAAINCAALTDELLEAELFGYARGAFTGAVGARVGLLEDAHEGTVFLDEVAELSARAQAKLLRVLQEGEIRRVGENSPRRVDVRLVSATNRSLEDAAGQGRYRDDLIYRLAVIRLKVPPLRDRIEDVPMLVQAFWRTMAARSGTRAWLGPDAVGALCRAAWPGNVRELQNVVAALAVGAPASGRIGSRLVGAVLAERTARHDTPGPVSLARARVDCDRRVVAAALARHGNQRATAARELGVSRQGLAKLITRLNLEIPAVKSLSSLPDASIHHPPVAPDRSGPAGGGDARVLAVAPGAWGSGARDARGVGLGK